MKNDINFNDLATACGVSKSTVSRALRNHPNISLKTREKVQRKAQELGYYQNPMVSAWMASLRKQVPAQEFSAVGWLNFEESKDFWTGPTYFRGLVNGARKQIELAHCILEEFWMREPGMTPDRMVDILKARGIAGLVIPHNTLGTIDDKIDVFNRHFKCVMIDKPLPGMTCVQADLYGNMQLAIKTLWQRGYRKIGFCAWTPHETGSRNLAGSAFLTHNRLIDEDLRVPYLEFEEGDIDAIVMQWYRRHQPEVIICMVQFIEYLLLKNGIRIPEDVGIVDLNLNNDDPHRSGIDQRHPQIGAKAASLLMGQMGQPQYFDDIHARVLVRGRWVDGQTTRPV